MEVRLWFWSHTNPMPHIIDCGNGRTIREAMLAMFVPVFDKAWRLTIEDDDVYLRRQESGYCGQEVIDGEVLRVPHVEEPKLRVFRPQEPKPRVRVRLQLEDKPARKRLSL